MMKTRQWVLAKRPAGNLHADNFRMVESEVDDVLAEGEILVKSVMFGFAPTLRNWMNEEGQSYRASIGIGEPIRGPGVFEVIKSNAPQWQPGTKLMGLSSWQEYFKCIPDPSTAPVIPLQEGIAPKDALGVYGLNSLTAYTGLTKIGEPKPGETLVVSGAAGSVGAMVSQIGKILGCRVIAIAGGDEKCRWLEEACGVDATIDYKSENVAARLAELCPLGVDIFFDNVGGDILQAVVDNIAKKARIIVCGQISAYDSDDTAPGPKDMMKIVYWSVKVQGFVLADFANDLPEAQQALAKWVREGRIVHREDVRHGFENLPLTLLDLFNGKNQGTLMLEV